MIESNIMGQKEKRKTSRPAPILTKNPRSLDDMVRFDRYTAMPITKSGFLGLIQAYKRKLSIPLTWYQALFRVLIRVLSFFSSYVQKHSREAKLSVLNALETHLKSDDESPITLTANQQAALQCGKLNNMMQYFRNNALFWSTIVSEAPAEPSKKSLSSTSQ